MGQSRLTPANVEQFWRGVRRSRPSLKRCQPISGEFWGTFDQSGATWGNFGRFLPVPGDFDQCREISTNLGRSWPGSGDFVLFIAILAMRRTNIFIGPNLRRRVPAPKHRPVKLRVAANPRCEKAKPIRRSISHLLPPGHSCYVQTSLPTSTSPQNRWFRPKLVKHRPESLDVA